MFLLNLYNSNYFPGETLLGQENVGVDFIIQNVNYFGTLIIFSIVAFLIALIASLSILSISLKKDKYTFSEALKLGLKNYFGYLLLVIVIWIFLAGLFILLIIPGIIFMVYWTLASYVFINEKKGIIASLKESMRLVKGRWWKTLGYGILIFLIVIAIGIGIGLIGMVIQLILGIPLQGHSVGAFWMTRVVDFVSKVFTTPIIVLFFKNMYLDYRKRKN